MIAVLNTVYWIYVGADRNRRVTWTTRLGARES